jgi:hypothetical protein
LCAKKTPDKLNFPLRKAETTVVGGSNWGIENLIIPNQWTMELLLAGTSSSVLTQRAKKKHVSLICKQEMSARSLLPKR